MIRGASGLIIQVTNNAQNLFSLSSHPKCSHVTLVGAASIDRIIFHKSPTHFVLKDPASGDNTVIRLYNLDVGAIATGELGLVGYILMET